MKNFLGFIFTLFFVVACTKAQNNETFNGKNYSLSGQNNNAEITLGFDNKENRFFGKAAVNNYFGIYAIDGNNISFANMGATMMMGERELMDVEAAYIENMSKVNSYKLDGKKLYLYTGDGKELVFDEIVQ